MRIRAGHPLVRLRAGRSLPPLSRGSQPALQAGDIEGGSSQALGLLLALPLAAPSLHALPVEVPSAPVQLLDTLGSLSAAVSWCSSWTPLAHCLRR